jgi:hypothetical protein
MIAPFAECVTAIISCYLAPLPSPGFPAPRRVSCHRDCQASDPLLAVLTRMLQHHLLAAHALDGREVANDSR